MSATSSLQPLQSFGPVCGLKTISSSEVLVGEGPLLSLYNYQTQTKLITRQIFKRNKIHGIQCLNDLILVWGGQHMSIFTKEDLVNVIDFPVYGIGDWITYALLSKTGDKVYVLSAHNLVHVAKISNGGVELVQNVTCGWKSILYSGTLYEDTESGSISVIAGTVMNGIIIWDLEKRKISHTLTEHEGSIFNVTVSANGQFLASCSDDRSIKVWDMKSGSLLANGWGHGSRIWGLSIYDVKSDGQFKIFSASEDLTSRIWSYNVGQDELSQERTVYGHTGRHVWSVDVYGENLIGFTGGADGKVLMIDLGQESREGYSRSQWQIENIKITDFQFSKGEMFKEYVDFGYGLCAITNLGNVLSLVQYSQWEFLFSDKSFERFSIVQCFDKLPIVLIGNKFGKVYLLKFTTHGKLDSKIELDVSADLSRLATILVSDEDESNLTVFFESSNPKDPILSQKIDAQLNLLDKLLLAKPNDKTILNAVTYDQSNDLYIFACRYATLVIYQKGQSQPLVALPKVIHGDTMSSIKMIPSNGKCLMYVTNKDSNYYIISFDPKTKDLEFIQSSKIQRGFLEGLTKFQNDVLLFGFKSDCFFLWNETGQYEIMREVCGGPHRRWSFKSWTKENKLMYRFVYTKSSEVVIVSNEGSFDVKTLERGLHGRETRDVVIVDNLLNEDEKIVITGAEDTTLKISTLTKDGYLAQDWTFREHVAGMQSVGKVNNEYILSTSAREELFVWKLNHCDGKKCLCLINKLPPASSNPDLRIMNFDTLEVFNDQEECIGFVLVTVYSDSTIKVSYYDIEKKSFSLIIDDHYQTCCIFHSHFVIISGKVYILIGSTNGHATVYEITASLNEHNFKLKGHSLQIIGELTNNISKLDKLVINQQLHQSSIKALDLIHDSENKVILATGGDDNALIVSEIVHNDDSLLFSVLSMDESAASSTITTLNKVDANHILVAAVDQSVKLWQIRPSLEVIESKYTTVADTGCSSITEFQSGEKLAILGGAGLSVWRINNL